MIGEIWRGCSLNRFRGLCAQVFPQVFKWEFTNHNKQLVGLRIQAPIPKMLQLKVTKTFSIKFWGLPFERTQTNPAHKVQTKQTAGRKSEVPATLAHIPLQQTKIPQNSMVKTTKKVNCVLFGKVFSVWGGCRCSQ